MALPALAPSILCLVLAHVPARADAPIVPDSTPDVPSQVEGDVGRIDPPPEAPVSTPDAAAPAPSLLLTAVLLAVACPCAWAIWRWRLLAPRPGAFPPAVQPWDAGAGEADRLRLRLESATLLVSGLCVWVSQSLGAASARTLFQLSLDDASTPRGIALLSAGAYAAAAIAATLCLVALPGMAQRLGLAPRRADAVSGAILFALVFPIVLAIGTGALWFSYWYALITDQPVPSSVAHKTLSALVAPGAPRDAAWWGAIAAVVFGAPLVEEIIYRGCLQSAIDRAFRGFGRSPGAWPVVLMSVIFAMAHIGTAEPRALVTLFVLSLAFGAAYRRTGSIVTPLVMHSLFNAANIALAL